MAYPVGPLRQTSPFGPILLAIKDKILADVLPSGDVVIAKNIPAVPSFLAGTQGVRIMCGGIRTTENYGAGRYFKVMQRVVTIDAPFGILIFTLCNDFNIDRHVYSPL